jgi:ParB family transcriptional regulator, chromosome partitioning protein
MLPAPPEPIRTRSYSQQKATLAMSNIIAVPLNKLTRSARNVRKSGGESIDDLASSILVHGLIHNLTVVEQLADNGENSGKYEVVAGDRRFAALQRLAKQKKVPKTFAVPCLVVDPAAATETSLAENTIRVAMHPADQFIAFHDLVLQSGLGIDDVAARFGVSPLFVRQRLKLANVAPRFIKAYQAEEIRLDQLEALAITDDQQAQEKVWDSLRHDWERSPHNLRSLLTEKHVSASDRHARFVGVDAYVAAGGTLERDLFDEENEGYLADPALLDRLVTERSASLAADLEGQGWAWPEVHLENEALEKYNTLRPAPVDLDPALLAEADKLRADLDAIDHASEDEEPSEAAERRRNEIENRLDEIEAAETEFTSEQKSQAGVIVTIGHNGKPVYHCGLVERGAKGPSTNGDDSNSPQEEKEDVSAALLQDLTTQRTAALRAALSVRPDIALIAVTHNLAAQIFYDQTYLLPSSLTVRPDAHADGFDLRAAAESEAAKAITEQTKDVRNLLPSKLELLWDWALEQPQNVLLKVLAVAVAHTVNAVQSPHDDASTGRLAAADALNAPADVRSSDLRTVGKVVNAAPDWAWDNISGAELWGALCWDLREALGQKQADELLREAWFLLNEKDPSRVEPGKFREHLVNSAQKIENGKFVSEIKEILKRRGL